MPNRPTLVCVHAHPDDEALFTAGTSAHYAELGYRVVLITCTNGQLGIDGSGRPGSDPAHDLDETRSVRARELQLAAIVAGFERVITLGYDDSGMRGWAQNESPDAFMNADVDAVARTIAAILDEVGADVVVTYDENGFYGHPDHVMANVVTRRALDFAQRPERLFYPVVPASVLTSFVDAARVTDAQLHVGDDDVTTTMDVRSHAARKQRTIATHASQIDNADLVGMDEGLFELLFGTEYYQCAWNRHHTTTSDTDLFGGLR